MPAAPSHLEKIAHEAIEEAIIPVLQRSRTSSDDPDLCKLWDEVRGKHRNFNWESDYATDVITTATEDYNSRVESNEQLNRTEFTNTYLDSTQKKGRRVLFAKINDPTCPQTAIPQSKFKESKLYAASKNDAADRGLPKCFASKYNKKDLKELIVLLEVLTVKKRGGHSITSGDIPEHLRSFFKGLKNKKQSIILAILDLRTAFELQKSECGFHFGGEIYTADQIAKLFQGEIDDLILVFDAFLEGKKVVGGVEMLRKFTGVSCMNDFLVVAATIYEGIQIVLDQVIDKELFPSLGGQVLPACVGVVSLQCSDCQCILVIICISSLLTIPHHCCLSETKGFHHH
jgi:hypothetical protein